MLIYILSGLNGFLWSVPAALLFVRLYEFVMKKKGSSSFDKWAIPISFFVAVTGPLMMWLEKTVSKQCELVDDVSGISFAIFGFLFFVSYGYVRGIFKM